MAVALLNPSCRVRGLEAGGALLAALLAGGSVLALPVELIELGLTSTGLTEAVPALATPIGLGTRLVLAALPAGLAAWLFLLPTGPRASHTHKERDSMFWSKSFGLQALARFARGGDPLSAADSTPAPDLRPLGEAPPETAPSPELPLDLGEWLPRRRADMHPDAPPRPPLIASRDLPRLEAVPPADPLAVAMPAISGARPAAPVRVTNDDERARPLPRSPEPLSATQVESIRSILCDMDRPAARPAAVSSPEPLPAVPHGASTPDLQAAPLAVLLDRFERSVDQRNQPAPLTPPAAAPAPLAHAPLTVRGGSAALAMMPVEQEEVQAAPQDDIALRTALETLKRLSATSRRR